MKAKFGQNFLVNKRIAAKIVSLAELCSSDTVIEIGPGYGILTDLIVPLVKRLILIEIDKKIADFLKKRFSFSPNIEIINIDFMKYNFPQNLNNIKIIANLPYYIATAIIEKILPSYSWSHSVLMIQKEVAERMVAVPGTSAYGYFSIMCQYYASINKYIDIKPGSFNPKPKVMSTVVILKNKYPPPPPELLFSLIKKAFTHKRKTILNSLDGFLGQNKYTIEKILDLSKISKNSRPQDISLSQYLNLTYNIKK